MSAPDWVDREPGLPAALHELARVLRRAGRRWLITLLIATGVTGLVVAKLSRKRPVYKARAILSITEGVFADSRYSMGRGALQGYLANAVLSKKILYQIITELDLYPDMQRMGESEAVAELRADLEVAVFRNFFLLSGTEDRRSVRVAITYTSVDSALAVTVVQRLADTVIDHERDRQNRATDFMEEQALGALEEAGVEIRRREQRLAEIAFRLPTSEDHEKSLLQVESFRVKMEIQAFDIVLAQTRGSLTAAKAFRSSPLAVELAQLRAPVQVSPSARKRRLVMAGVFGFVVVLPMVAIFIGAFDPRIRNTEDVERIGLPVIGHVPSFHGDRSGALLDRLPKRRFWQRQRLSDPDRRA